MEIQVGDDMNSFYSVCRSHIKSQNLILGKISDALRKLILKEKISKEESNLLYGGDSRHKLPDLEPIVKVEVIESEMEKLALSQKNEIYSLKGKIAELESRFDDVRIRVVTWKILKEFTFTSIDNVQENIQLFDSKLMEMKL